MLPIASSTAPCGTASLRNTGQALRRFVQPLLPGIPVAVGNRTLTDLPAPMCNDALSRELAGVAQALAGETIDWATAIGGRMLARTAERLVPGLSAPFVAYTVFTSLCHARRGDLVRGLQTLPFGALLPARLMQELAGQLRPFLPDWVWDGVDHEPIVLGVAAYALVYALHRHGVEQPPRTRVGGSLVDLLRCLRALLSLRAGLREVLRRPSPRAALEHHLDRLPGTPPESRPSATAALGQTFPGASRALASAPCGLPGANAWPLWGAEARRRGTSTASRTGIGGSSSGKGTGGASGKSTATRSQGQSTAGRRTSRFTLTRRITTESDSSADSRRGAGGWVSGPRRATELAGRAVPPTAKESTAVARSRGDPAQASQPTRREEVPGGKLPEPWGAVYASNHGRGAGAEADAGSLPATGDATGGITAASGENMNIWVPHCLRFRPTRSPLDQLQKARFLPFGTEFCVRGNETSRFEEIFKAGGTGAGEAVYWMHANPVHFALTPPLRKQEMRKYSGLGQLRHAEPRDPLPIGRDEIYSLLTVSVLPDRAIRHHAVDDSQLLEKNSFRLLRVTGPDGAPRIFIAYFLNHAADICRGVKAGFMEIHTSADSPFSLTDENGGWTFSSDSLPDFIAGIERLSGCRFLPPANAGEGPLSVMALRLARPLFVREPATLCGKNDYDVQALKEDMPLFALRRLHLPGRNRHVDLYRHSFMILDDRLIYSNAEGRLHTVALVREEGAQDTCILDPAHGAAARFIDAMGLRAGERYQTLDLVERLESNGLTWMPTPPPADRD